MKLENKESEVKTVVGIIFSGLFLNFLVRSDLFSTVGLIAGLVLVALIARIALEDGAADIEGLIEAVDKRSELTLDRLQKLESDMDDLKRVISTSSFASGFPAFSPRVKKT